VNQHQTALTCSTCKVCANHQNGNREHLQAQVTFRFGYRLPVDADIAACQGLRASTRSLGSERKQVSAHGAVPCRIGTVYATEVTLVASQCTVCTACMAMHTGQPRPVAVQDVLARCPQHHHMAHPGDHLLPDHDARMYAQPSRHEYPQHPAAPCPAIGQNENGSARWPALCQPCTYRHDAAAHHEQVKPCRACCLEGCWACVLHRHARR
jgi:hypothetical protein